MANMVIVLTDWARRANLQPFGDSTSLSRTNVRLIADLRSRVG